MLTVHHISKTYSLNTILTDVSFSIAPGDRVGLIGPNGCGKTTLLRILAGEEKPDAGQVTRLPADLRVGYLPQGLALDPQLTLEHVLRPLSADPQALEAEVARLAEALALQPHNPSLQNTYDQALHELQALDTHSLSEAFAVIEALGLGELQPQTPLAHLSGGQKTRLSLALALLNRPQLLLLDEPTNHLDIGMLEWLEDWLARFPGAALIVSHDRTFLDRTVNRILDLASETHSLKEYSGNYSDYLSQYLAEKERHRQMYQDQVYEVRRLRQDIQRTKQQAAWVEQTTTPRTPGVRRIAKKVAKKAKAREKRLERYLDSEDRLEKPVQGWQMKLEFGATQTVSAVAERANLPARRGLRHLGGNVFATQDLAIGYPGYSPLLQNLDLQFQAGRRVALTGPNGCGKSTLLRTIAGQLPPVEGKFTLGASVQLGYMAQEQELLDPHSNAVETLRQVAPMDETEARSFLHYFLFSGDDALRPVAQLSFGERARLMLASLVASGCNFLLLDEPINHLDIPSRERFEQALTQFPGAVLAVVHDRYFIQRYATDLWLVEDGRVRREVLVI